MHGEGLPFDELPLPSGVLQLFLGLGWLDYVIRETAFQVIQTKIGRLGQIQKYWVRRTVVIVPTAKFGLAVTVGQA